MGSEFIKLVTLADYNTRVVIAGTMLLGLASGIIGSFMLLRKRSLMGDAVSHATLPGIAIAFMVMVGFGGDGKSLAGLLLGALIAGLLGMGVVLLIRGTTRLKEDAALGIVLSVFFGFGVAVLGVIQTLPEGSAAGLSRFIYGKTASMLRSDAELIAVFAAVIALTCTLLFKEFTILCFDQGFTASQGWPVALLDTLMMGMVVVITVIGLQAVGIILVIAMLIIPPAAARFWTDHLVKMVIASALIGAISGLLGAALSALLPKLPAGAIIVLVASAVFFVSMVVGPARGILMTIIEHVRLEGRVAHQHLLRELYERYEQEGDRWAGVRTDELLEARTWSPRRLERLLGRSLNKGLISRDGDSPWRLTPEGTTEAERLVRNHRLWEVYLITHADIAPSHVDRDADQIEHVLGRPMVEKLEALLKEEHPELVMPTSPHRLEAAT